MRYWHSLPFGTGTRWVLFLILIILAAVKPLWAETRFAPDISSFELENGIKLVVIPDRRAPVVTHAIWYRVGSADDPKGKSGLAHFLEHLMFKKTKNHGFGEFSDAVASIGGQENAFTSADYTAYYQRVAPAALGEMMAFEADRMKNLVLSQEEVLSEREVILEERTSRVDASPESILSEMARAMIFLHHPYGTPVIGWEHEIRDLGRADALAFYKKWYQPWNATVIVAGDVDTAAVKDLAVNIYGKLETTSPQVKRTRLRDPEPVAGREIVYRDRRVAQPRWSRQYLVPPYKSDNYREAMALDLLGEILGGSSTSRMRTNLVIENSIANSAGAYYDGSSMDYGTFWIYGTPRNGSELADLVTAIETEIDEILKNGVTGKEVEKAKRNFLKSLVFSQDSQVSLARIIGSIVSTGGSVEDFVTYPERLDTITAEEIGSVARRYLQKIRSVTSTLLPEEG